jgi:SAM-dependent methyltransferase
MVQEATDPTARLARRRIVDDDVRAGWLFLLDLPDHGTVLDLGCGLGALSLQLSRFYDQVVACDLTPERIQFLKIRAAQEGRTNIEYVCAGDTPRLPFPSAYFDTVILNGVLEWVPESHNGDPQAIQQAFLAEIKRILRPRGQLYLAIENRLGYEYFFGKPDNHSNLLYGSLLPRPLANQYSLARRGRPYRTYTYGIGGYRRLLRNAGFACQHFYSTVPDYRHIEQMVDVTDRSQMRFDLPLHRDQSPMSIRLLKSALYRYFAPSYGIVAGATVRGRFIDELVAHADQALGASGSHAKSLVNHYLLSQKGMLICPITGGMNSAVLRVPLTDIASAHARRNADGTQALHDSPRLPDGVRRRIPRPLIDGKYRRVHYFVETLLPGVSAAKLKDDSIVSQAVTAAAEFSLDLHRATAGTAGVLAPKDYERLVGQHISAVRSLTESPQHKTVLDHLEAYLGEAFAGRHPLPLVSRIGDLGLSNILVDPVSGSLEGIVDWDRADQRGLPFLDIAHLIASWLRRRRAWTAGEVMIRDLLPGLSDEHTRTLIRGYCDGLGLSTDLVRPLILAWWVQFVAGRLDFRVELDESWMARNVWAVCEYLATDGRDLIAEKSLLATQ